MLRWVSTRVVPWLWLGHRRAGRLLPAVGTSRRFRRAFASRGPHAENARSTNSLTLWVSPVATNVVVGLVLLQHTPHRANVIARESPITTRIEVTEHEFVLQAVLDTCDAVSDFSRDEFKPAPR